MSSTTVTTTGAGLEGVVAGESEICYIDGYAGVLSYRGYNIHTLAEHATFEEVIWLLWKGKLPDPERTGPAEGRSVRELRDPAAGLEFLKANRQGVADGRAAHRRFDAQPLRSAREGYVARGESDEGDEADGADVDHRQQLRPVSRGRAAVSLPDSKLSFAGNFLYCLTGKKPDNVMEHVVRRRADSACRSRTERFHVRRARHRGHACPIFIRPSTSAIGALKGPLHGGANEDVIRMLLASRDRG